MSDKERLMNTIKSWFEVMDISENRSPITCSVKIEIAVR